jgi:predicted adenine nucleotide alpha hydrolase (AANH) superfamily ATPase
MNIKELYIFSIHKSKDEELFQIEKNNSKIYYLEVNIENFTEYLQRPKESEDSFSFVNTNDNSLYILRDGNYLDVKNIFSNIEGHNTNIERGASQKAHIMSPLDFRLASYLMAICNMNYQLYSSLNTFYYLTKDKYLPYGKHVNIYKKK